MTKVFDDISSLALFGASPAFENPRVVGAPITGDKARFLKRLDGVFSRNRLTNCGPLVEELETRFSEACGVSHAMAFCNGTTALQTVIRALGLTGEIIVPSFTFVATVHAIHWMGLTPVFADIDPVTCTLDPESAARAITPRTSAIIGVHLWGNRCKVEALQHLADKHNLKLVFDAAHAVGCHWNGVPAGGEGDASVFSLHATKILHSFEGGMVTTTDSVLADQLRLMRNFGFSDYDTVVCAGTNGKMTEPAAAMALTNLESMNQSIAINRENVNIYEEIVEGVPGLELLPSLGESGKTCHYVIASVDTDRFGLSRDQLMAVCHAENLMVRRYFYPGCHRMEPYGTLYPDAGTGLPVTESWCDQVLVFPTGPAMSRDDLGIVERLLRYCHDQGADIEAHFRKNQE